MAPRVNSRALAPLLAIAQNDPNPVVRSQTLDLASRLPLTEEAWRALWATVDQVTAGLGSDIGERASALAVAVRIPLLSVRRKLRALAADSTEPAAIALSDALAKAGDRSQIGRLLEEANAGRWPALESLAAMPIEEEGLAPSRLSAPADAHHAEARLWHALALARLGDFQPIDAFLVGREPEPEFFYGDPWSAYARIAAIRPLPAGLHAHLREALGWTEQIDDHSRARMARIIAWAATGSADAEGSPLPDDEEIGTDASPSQGQWDAALAAAKAFFQETAFQDQQVAAAGAASEDESAQFVARVIGAANLKASGLAPDVPASQAVGNQVIDLLRLVPRVGSWPVAAVIGLQLGASRTALDDEQIAWVIAQAPVRDMVRELAEMLASSRWQAERSRILRIGIAAADFQAGRGGSPVRGAGGGAGGAPAGRAALIEDDERPGDRFGDELRIPPSPPDVDERRVHATILQGGRRRKAFVTGTENVIRCWIGLPEPGAAAADANIPSVQIPPQGLPLQVQLCWRDGGGRDHADTKPMLLPAERTARSGDCDLHVHVPEGERYVGVEIMFRYRGRTFEMVRVEAFALAPGETEGLQHEILVRAQTSRRETIDMPDSQLVQTTFVFGGEASDISQPSPGPGSFSLRAFGQDGVRRLDLSDAGEAISWLNKTLFETEKLVVRRRALPGTVTPAEDVLDAGDQDVRRFLRDMARHGAELYNRLAIEGVDNPGERVQVLNHEPKIHVPLEFVYDGGYPVSEAKVCAAGLEALRSDAVSCPDCSLPAPEEKRASAPVICPFGFWSIRKVIERVGQGGSGKGSAPRAARRGLPILDAVAFASSHLVPEDERRMTREALQQSFRRLFPAEDWDQWRRAMKEHPSLLLLMPHHGLQANLDYLEIGDANLPEDLGKLSRAQLLREYINVDGRDPGPIVLLLGCQTAARTESGYVQITHLIQERHASIVLGTLAEILGRHAAPMARELVAELVSVKDTQTDFGTVMRRVRRRMLARGYLMALCLVALGDAEWRLTPRPDIDPARHP